MNEREREARAQLAYQAYGQVTDFKNYQGLPMPSWSELPPKIREAWGAAAQALSELATDERVAKRGAALSPDARRAELETICFTMGDAIRGEMNDKRSGPPIGFVLLLADFGPDGFMAYTGNVPRPETIKLLREHLTMLEGRTN